MEEQHTDHKLTTPEIKGPDLLPVFPTLPELKENQK